MLDINDFLNRRYSTRNLSDEVFDSVVGNLAKQLEDVSFHVEYTDKQLHNDWNKLNHWITSDNYINSTSRIGMKLCEHFFPNFFKIENSKGVSFRSMWKAPNLEKILRWNRQSHSTPYLSELKRGIYFCCGMTKSTMFRPQMAKLTCLQYAPKNVLDPCAGWGGRMIGTVASGANYYAFEPNTETYNNLMALATYLNIHSKVHIFHDDALKMDDYDFPTVDMVITSPPYFDVEVYNHEKTQSVTNHNSYESWKDGFFVPLMAKCEQRLSRTGVSCWNVGKVGKNDMSKDVFDFHSSLNYNHINTLSVVSSKRQSNQNANRNEKSQDTTNVFKL
jgi:16S rRNA G966 N2-methylase RsmD